MEVSIEKMREKAQDGTAGREKAVTNHPCREER